MRYFILLFVFVLVSCSSPRSNNFWDDFDNADDVNCMINSVSATCYITINDETRQWQCKFGDKNNLENCKIVN